MYLVDLETKRKKHHLIIIKFTLNTHKYVFDIYCPYILLYYLLIKNKTSGGRRDLEMLGLVILV